MCHVTFSNVVEHSGSFLLPRSPTQILTLLADLCSKMYTYKNIFKRLLMSIYLTTKPQNGVELFNETMKTIAESKIFTESLDPSDIVRENLLYFLSEYDCF